MIRAFTYIKILISIDILIEQYCHISEYNDKDY